MELADVLHEGTEVHCLGCFALIARLRRDAAFGQAVVEDLFAWAGRPYHNGELARCDECGCLWLTAWLQALRAAHRWSCGCLVAESFPPDVLIERAVIPPGGVILEGCNSRAPGTTPTNLSLHETGARWWREDARERGDLSETLPSRIRVTVAVDGQIVRRVESERQDGGYSYALDGGVSIDKGQLATIVMMWEGGGRAEMEFPAPFTLRVERAHPHGGVSGRE